MTFYWVAESCGRDTGASHPAFPTGEKRVTRAGNSRRRPRVPPPPVVREPSTSGTRCYLCGRVLQRDEGVVRRCYEQDIRRGR